ncbi:MAG: N-acetyltransferase family protein [Pseudomonadota bacterium]
MTSIRPAIDRDLPEILEIVNDAILNSTAWYDERPRNLEEQRAWLHEKRADGWPVFTAVDDEDDSVLGFATFGTFRARPAYRHTAEHSVYVGRHARGKGAGRLLTEALIDEATRRGLHVLIGGVDSANEGSIAFHETMGFTEVGRLPQIGYKFDTWLTLVFMQRILGDA